MSSDFIGWSMINSDLGISLKIIPMEWVVLNPSVVSSLWSKVSAMNCRNLFCDSNSISLSKSSKFTLDRAPHFLNFTTFENETEHPAKWITSTKSRYFDTLWTNSPIDKRSGDNYPSFFQNCISVSVMAIFWNFLFFCPVYVRDLE